MVAKNTDTNASEYIWNNSWKVICWSELWKDEIELIHKWHKNWYQMVQWSGFVSFMWISLFKMQLSKSLAKSYFNIFGCIWAGIFIFLNHSNLFHNFDSISILKKWTWFSVQVKISTTNRTKSFAMFGQKCMSKC